MEYAKLITVRSTKDRELLSTLVNTGHTNKIHYFRDLGYVFPHRFSIEDYPRIYLQRSPSNRCRLPLIPVIFKEVSLCKDHLVGL